MTRIGPAELLLILLICLLLWGPTRVPDLGRSLGRAIREFRHGLRGESTEEESKALAEKSSTK